MLAIFCMDKYIHQLSIMYLLVSLLINFDAFPYGVDFPVTIAANE